MSHNERYNEKQLLGRMALGEEAAFQQLFDIYGQKVFSFALYLIRSESIAGEITRELFLKVWARRSSLPEIRHFQLWFSGLIQEHVYAALRRLARERRMLGGERELTECEFPSEYERLLQAAIDRLPPHQRDVYLLRAEGMRYPAIADKTGLSLRIVKDHVGDAIRDVRLFLETHDKAYCSACSSETG